MQEWILEIITNFNGLIDTYAEPEYKEKWKVKYKIEVSHLALQRTSGDLTWIS